MKKIPQSYYDQLPSPGLQRFVDELPPGEYDARKLQRTWIWCAANDDHHYNEPVVFRYALKKAGMRYLSTFRMLKP